MSVEKYVETVEKRSYKCAETPVLTLAHILSIPRVLKSPQSPRKNPPTPDKYSPGP
jgi:hypothetical protein